jgi:hypothetical protein
MGKVLIGVVVALLVAAELGAWTATAHAADRRGDRRPDRRPCVSVSEFEGIRDSWRRPRIERFTETGGVLRATMPNGIQVWDYLACRPRWDQVTVAYATDGHWLSIGHG